MDISEWMAEEQQDLLCHVRDWMRSRDYLEDMEGIEEMSMQDRERNAFNKELAWSLAQERKTQRTLEEVKQIASQRGCEVLEVQTKEGACIILFDEWFIDGLIARYENNHYGYEDACQWLERFAAREELIGMAVDVDALPSDMLPF